MSKSYIMAGTLPISENIVTLLQELHTVITYNETSVPYPSVDEQDHPILLTLQQARRYAGVATRVIRTLHNDIGSRVWQWQ